ncbi:MAG: hypothetical protein H6999_05980 [Hahellaceae bacterium]|nr:hypothetical protein [Hahellaceae bacterium]MCP5169289.1 hypothetical protein [Hahellaceae bacterium]
MKLNKKLGKLVETAMGGIDTLGFQLDSMGITSRVNRHTLIAFVMAEQKRAEGELDSLKARIGSNKFKIEKTIAGVEATVQNTINTVLTPARNTVKTVRGFIG